MRRIISNRLQLSIETNHLLAAVLLIALLAVSAGFLGEFAPAIYLSGLYFLLVLCSYFFIMVILAVEMKS